MLLVVGPLISRAEESPKLYTYPLEEAETTLDPARAKFGAKYEIVNIDKSRGYVKPKVTAGSLPDRAITPSGEELSGYVLVGYVVTPEGRVADAFVIETTDERLNATALAATEGWRFEPATLDGSTIATIAGQEFEFGDKTKPRGFQTSQVVLYQNDDVLTDRISDAQVLARYIKQLEAVVTEFFARDEAPEKLTIVVALRPGGLSRVWFVASKRAADDERLRALRKKLEKIAPVEVTGGAMAFAIMGRIASAEDNTAESGENFQPPMPAEWTEAVKGQEPAPIAIDALLDAAWPEKK
jgi:TonB family protein